MGSRVKYPLYNDAQRFVTNKDVAIQEFISHMLDKLQSMFVYEGLPDTLPPEELELILQTTGQAFVTKWHGNLYAFRCSDGGELDEYYRPKTVIVVNEALNLNQEYAVGVDGVLIRNDFQRRGLIPLLARYGVLLTDADISMRTVAVLSRITMLISAADDRTRASAESFVSKILDGDFSVISESQFLDGVKLQAPNTNSATRLTDFIELIQYYRATLSNELGLQQNFNMKRERLNTSEVGANTDVIMPLVDGMIKERRRGIELVNDLYGLSASVGFDSAWKLEHAEMVQDIDVAETVITEEPLDATGTVSRETLEEPDQDPQANVNVSRETLEEPDQDPQANANVSRETLEEPDQDPQANANVSRETLDEGGEKEDENK